MTAAKSAVPPNLKIPDVDGLSLKDAALRYAEAGFYILPVSSPKNPGSIVHKGWPEKSSVDPDQIEAWWTQHPNAGIAIHTGKSGLTAFDLDTDTLPEELAWMRTGIVQFSRAESVGSERSHNVFYTGDEAFTSGRLKLLDGTKVGEVRNGNTVIIAAPSPHAKAADGGLYRWRTTDLAIRIPPLPDLARNYLRPYGTRNRSGDTHTAMAGWCVEADDVAVKRALRDWRGNDRAGSFAGMVNKVRDATEGTRDDTRDALRVLASEARIGFYPLQDAVAQIREAMIASYEKRGEPEKFDAFEFRRLVANGVGYALSRSPREITMEANRDFGTHHEDDDYDDDVERELRKLEVRAEAKRRFDSKGHKPFSEEPLSLTELLKRPPNPTPQRIENVMPDGGLVLFAAPPKAGKTTVVGNLIRSLVDSDPFLGTFTVNKPAKRLVLIDNELPEDMVRDWLLKQQIKNTDSVVDVIRLRGQCSTFDILSDRRRTEWAKRLREIGCDYLILDCLSPIFEAIGLDENHDAGKFINAFRELQFEAGMAGDSTIVHHMGHSNERARGDSKLLGEPDALWKYVWDDPDDPMSPRYFSAFGRGVEVAQGLVEYDAATRHLKYRGQSRADMKKQQRDDAKNEEKRRKAKLTFGVIVQILRTDIADKTRAGKPETVGLSGKQIETEAMKTDGVTQQSVRDALKNGRDTGELAHWPGSGGSTIHTIGELLENDD